MTVYGLNMENVNIHSDTTYPMRVVTRLTGLSAAAIRVWERRYQAVVPMRTEGNSRRYTGEDVRRLILLRQATVAGHSIKDIARLSEADLQALVQREPAVTPEADPIAGTAESSLHGDVARRVLDEYLTRIAAFDARPAAEVLGQAAVLLPPEDFVFDIAMPILREVGNRWEHKEFTVAHEHLVSEHIKALLANMIRFANPHPGAPRIICATPEGHLHEIGAQVGALLAANRGFDPVYLGPSVPVRDLQTAVRLAGADLVLLAMIHSVSQTQLRLLKRDLGKLTQDTDVWLGLPPGHEASELSLPRLTQFHSFRDLDMALTGRVAAAR